MTKRYEGSESERWESRIKENDRYSSVGINGLPDNVNKYRKEALFDVLDRVADEEGIELKESSVLDAGCGTGIYSEYYSAKGANVYGVDISETAIEQINQLGIPGSYQTSELSDLPFPSGKFALAHVFSVLYHIVNDNDWEDSLDELDRVTRPGGLLLMRIEWVEETKRVKDHVKYRSKHEYLKILTEQKPFRLKGIYSFSDIVLFKRLFILANMSFPYPVAERIGSIVDKFSLLQENELQKIVVFEKRDE